jgi:HAD superfamily hydrolase (TIGR01509 family)
VPPLSSIVRRHETTVLCLIFDLDGTLVDSEPLSSQAFLDLLPDLKSTTHELMLQYRGHKLADVFEDLSRRIGRTLPADFEVQYRNRVAALYDTRLVPMPGVVDMLEALEHPFCVASNGPPHKMAHGLRATGLAKFFGNNVFSSYDIGHWKPEPHLFLHSAACMGVEPDACVVVEDSESGLLAAEAAGMRAIHYSHDGKPCASKAMTSINHFCELQSALEGIASVA